MEPNELTAMNRYRRLERAKAGRDVTDKKNYVTLHLVSSRTQGEIKKMSPSMIIISLPAKHTCIRIHVFLVAHKQFDMVSISDRSSCSLEVVIWLTTSKQSFVDFFKGGHLIFNPNLES